MRKEKEKEELTEQLLRRMTYSKIQRKDDRERNKKATHTEEQLGIRFSPPTTCAGCVTPDVAHTLNLG